VPPQSPEPQKGPNADRGAPPGHDGALPAGGRLVLPGGETIALGPRPLTAGRSVQSDIRLDETVVSRHHARFALLRGQPTVEDLNSGNGTYVNGERIREVHRLDDGDRIEIGSTVLVFRQGAGAEPRTAPPAAAPGQRAPLPPPERAAARPPRPAAPAAPPRAASAAAAPAPPVEPAASTPAPPAQRAASPPAPPVAPAAPAAPVDRAHAAGPPPPDSPAPAPPPAAAAPAPAPAATGEPAARRAMPLPPADLVDASLAPPPSDVTRHQRFALPSGQAAVELRPLGALSIESAQTFGQLCHDLLGEGVTHFYLDLAALEHVDSTGLGVLLQICREARSRGGGAWLYGVRPAVQQIFELTNLVKVLRLVPSREAALAEAQER